MADPGVAARGEQFCCTSLAKSTEAAPWSTGTVVAGPRAGTGTESRAGARTKAADGEEEALPVLAPPWRGGVLKVRSPKVFAGLPLF